MTGNMPGLIQRNAQFGIVALPQPGSSLDAGGSASSLVASGIWGRHGDHVTFGQLQKFWSELSPQERRELLRIDKQTLFEQARKNLYCSRCNGLLLEGYSQIIMYGKSLHRDGGGSHLPNKLCTLKNGTVPECQDDSHDPSVHPWGGLAVTRDGILTLLDCFLDGKSLKALQNVFDSARSRERDREMLYPDACGGGGRGWISQQGMTTYGRGHGTRETCALHTARLSCDTLVDFWSALSDETRASLLRMKEEDFIERLMYRFDSKRFCRDCRRNVIKEFKELKELKRMRREPRCTSWFCVADTAFQYEVSDDTVQADWHQSFTDTVGTYHHFEWAIGTGEAKSDILEFEDVGMNGNVQAHGLDLGGLSACFITLRAWKLDGRCTEFTVKAHALKGHPCVHRRLVVGDGYVTITKGESIRRFFEHAEEAEEEEDDDSMDKDGSDLDGDGSHPQKHAKSPELAREFLLDAATVIFKEQVEKAFREGTARQNAHIIFVGLALKLLEDRVHVACKEIITLEKQIKLLEEEEKEKREEEERKERRRIKEREKKLRRKERLKGKERDRERKNIESQSLPYDSQMTANESSVNGHMESMDSISEPGDNTSSEPLSSDTTDEQPLTNDCDSKLSEGLRHPLYVDGDLNVKNGNCSLITEQSKSSRRKLRFRNDSPLDPSSKWCDKRRSTTSSGGVSMLNEYGPKLIASSRCSGASRQPRGNIMKSNADLKHNENFQCSNRMRDRYDFSSCGCTLHNDYGVKDGQRVQIIRSGLEKNVNKSESGLEGSRSAYHSTKYSKGCYVQENGGIPRGNTSRGEALRTKKVWEPLESRKKYPKTTAGSEVTLKTSDVKVHPCDGGETDELQHSHNACKSMSADSGHLKDATALNKDHDSEDNTKNSPNSGQSMHGKGLNGFDLGTKPQHFSKEVGDEEVGSANNNSAPVINSSSSDNCSSCLSEGDSGSSSSSVQNTDSSTTLDSEDVSPQSEARETQTCTENAFLDERVYGKCQVNGFSSSPSGTSAGFPVISCTGAGILRDVVESTPKLAQVDIPQQRHILQFHSQSIHLPIFPASSTMGYHHHHQATAPWSAGPTTGLMPFQPNHYLYQSPLGYGLSPNPLSEFCMSYGALPPIMTPAPNLAPIQPSYQDPIKANAVNSIGGGAAKSSISLERRVVHSEPVLQKASLSGQNGTIGNSTKSLENNSAFSLFHFGGPVPVAAGRNLNPAAPNGDGVAIPHLPSDPISAKETTVEEYRLFNGGRFSFF
ncbi:hypothetical protein QJS10_CPA09g00324 [Acorus calamus]|uniref:Uncharacterized protein n=1 Tax=Acorus calamus TaxID=4465 RepID=A0AAV9E320_ACOCL|nr:hypothetical protein QJS10_CPA09g00324 [Acorus calamus]